MPSTVTDTTAVSQVSETETETSADTRVLVSEVDIVSIDDAKPITPELLDIVYEAVATEPGRTTTREQLQTDINSVFATGLFSNVKAEPEDTPYGVRVTFLVEPNPILTRVSIPNRQVLADGAIDEIFGDQYGKRLNLRDFQAAVLALDDWYEENGYVLAQVVEAPEIEADGTVTIIVAEGEIESIEVRAMAFDGMTTDAEGNPFELGIQSFVVTREFETRPGDVFQERAIQQDIARVDELGLFEDIRLSLDPGELNPRKVSVVINVEERSDIESIGGSFGLTGAGTQFLSVSYENDNFSGTAQSLSAEARVDPAHIVVSADISSVGAPTRVTSTEGLAARELLVAEDNAAAIEKQLWIVERLRQAQQQGKVALSLNNLGQLYLLEKQPYLAIEVFDEASLIFQSLDSPGLELLMQMNLAQAYRRMGQTKAALEHYDRALSLVATLRDVTGVQPILGDRMLATLQPEWNIERARLDDRLIAAIPMVESTLLLDIVNTYSAMGDYQQALYAVNAPQMAPSFNVFNQVIADYIDQAAIFISEEASELRDVSESPYFPPLIAQLLTPESLNSMLSGATATVERVPDIMRALSLQFVYSDLEEASLVDFYKTQSEAALSTQSPALIVLANSIPQLIESVPALIEGWTEDPESWINTSEFFTSDLFTDEQQAQRLGDLSKEALTVFSEYWSQSSTSVVDIDYFEQRTAPLIDKFLDIVGDEMRAYFAEEGDLPREITERVDLEEIDLFLRASTTAVVKYAIASENGEDEFYNELIELSQTALDLWPSDYPIFRNFEWVRDFLFDNAQGYAYWQQARYPEALAAYAPLIASLERAPEVITHDNLTKFISTLPPEIAEAIDISPEVFDSLKPTILSYLQQVQISLYLRTGYFHLALDNFELAKSTYNKALALNEQSSGDQKIDLLSKAKLGELYYLIARIDSQQGDWDSAQAAIATAISYHEDYFPTEALTGGTSFAQAQLRYGYEVPGLGHLRGNVEVSSNNPWLKEASDQSDIAALTEIDPFEQTAVALTADMRKPCATSLNYFVCKQKYFAHYIEILRQRHEAQPGEGFDAQALEVSEQARVRSPQLFQNLKPPEARSPEEQRLFQRRSQLNELATLSEINNIALDDDTLLLEYFLGEEKSYLWLLAKDKKVEIYELPPRAVIEAQSREFLALLTEPSGWVRPKTTARVGEALSDMLLGPVADQLGQKRLVIVGDGLLQYLPFAALPDPGLTAIPPEMTPAGEFSPHMVPLIVGHEVVTLPSASALVAMRQDQQFRSTPTQELAIFADPVFNHKDGRVGSVRLSNELQAFSPEQLSEVDVLYGELPSTQKELSQIENLFPSGEKQIFSGFDASLENVLGETLGDFRIVHFATHGIFNSNSPERSGIILSGIDESGEVQPGLLSPSIAFNTLNLLDTELVVLSGCRTGLGQNAAIREGLTGFTGGLLAAGTDRVVTSLWSVRDDATQELMGRFYGYMLNETNPMPAAEALRAAQISMWEDPQWQTPYYWAAFVLQGEWQ